MCHSIVSRLLTFIFLLSSGYLSAQVPFPFPTDWKFETLQDESSDWWQSLRVNMVPGVSYTLQKSGNLKAEGWENLFSQYGTDGEWICPLFEGVPPVAPLANPQPFVPISNSPVMSFVWLVVEKDQTGSVLLSWKSLDDQTPKRTRISDIILDPVWEEYDSFYMNNHGNHMFAISPRIYSPVYYEETSMVLGAADSTMIENFKTSLPVITFNMRNSVAMAANYTPTPPAPGGSCFFRIAADWSLDSDGDGRFDWQEIIFDGSNPFATDSDGDGLPDVAQDNSGPEPTLEEGADAGMATFSTVPPGSSPLPPRARIEQTHISASRSAVYTPNWPGWDPAITVESGGTPPYPTESLRDKTTFAAFSAAVAALPLNENGWSVWQNPFGAKCFKTDALTTQIDPRKNGRYTDSFYVSHNAFRLRLDSPAPQGGYSIPLRIMSYVFRNPGDFSVETDGPFHGISHQDLMLTVAEGETLGAPVLAVTPDVGTNEQGVSVSLRLIIRSSNIDDDLDYQYRDPDQGLCLLAGEAFAANFDNDFRESENIKMFWQRRRLGGAGNLGEWETMNPLMSLAETQGDDPPDDLDSRHFAYLRSEAGIFQFQAVFSFPDGTKVPIPYLRIADGKSIENKDSVSNKRLKAGQPDYIGICRNAKSLDVRTEAIKWLGSTKYAADKQVSVKAGNPFNPDTKNRPKCNIFVTHISNRMGATTPYYYRKLVIPTAPLAKPDWYPNPERNIDLDGPGWIYRAVDQEPAPGMVVASPRTSAGNTFGHVGFLDYDGSWINAGAKHINKSLHLLDEKDDYKPNTFRSR